MLDKLKKYEGEVFYTVTGLPFEYKFVSNNAFVIVRDGKEINRIVHISQVEKAINMQPKKTTDICYKIIAGAYIFALIKDPRLQ